MKIQLLFAMARIGSDGGLIISAPGEVIDIDIDEGKTLIAQGQAVALDEPEPTPVKRVSKKVI